MTPADSNRTVALYRQALTLPADQRAAFVAEQAAGDTALRAAVLALLSGQPATAVGQPSGNGAAALAPGTRIGHYRIDGVLGAGGMGVVYRATDERLNRPVAIKFLAAELLDAAATARFKREAQMASALNHPHILTVYDVGEHEGRQFLVTELVDGGTLADWAAANPARRDWRRTIEMLAGVGDGLAAAHAAGILHRDLKPANVLVSKSGHAKLGDFGLAKPASDGVGATAAGIAVGTVAYMSPEQASGQRLDARSDIFSFGVLLYELLEGHGPFPGRSDLEVLQSILHGTPRPVRDDLPDALRSVIEKLLEKDPAERYQTMSDVVVDLRRALRKSSGEIRPSGQTTRRPRRRARTPADPSTGEPSWRSPRSSRAPSSQRADPWHRARTLPRSRSRRRKRPPRPSSRARRPLPMPRRESPCCRSRT
jgi:serine/threonine protein kinase